MITAITMMMSILTDPITVKATVYHATPNQTDDTPFITASNAAIDSTNPRKHRWIAVSRDLEKMGFVFGAEVCVEGADDLDGIWEVQDRLHYRKKKQIDFLVNSDTMGKWDSITIKLL